MEKQTYLQWLKQFEKDETALGDLARDTSMATRRNPKYKAKPINGNRQDWHTYLSSFSVRACQEAIDAMHEAFDLYEAYLLDKGGCSDFVCSEQLGLKEYTLAVTGENCSDGCECRACGKAFSEHHIRYRLRVIDEEDQLEDEDDYEDYGVENGQVQSVVDSSNPR